MWGGCANRKPKLRAFDAALQIQYRYRCPRRPDVVVDLEKTKIGHKGGSTIRRQLDLMRFFSYLYDLSSGWIRGGKQNDSAWSLLHNKNGLAARSSC